MGNRFKNIFSLLVLTVIAQRCFAVSSTQRELFLGTVDPRMRDFHTSVYLPVRIVIGVLNKDLRCCVLKAKSSDVHDVRAYRDLIGYFYKLSGEKLQPICDWASLDYQGDDVAVQQEKQRALDCFAHAKAQMIPVALSESLNAIKAGDQRAISSFVRGMFLYFETQVLCPLEKQLEKLVALRILENELLSQELFVLYEELLLRIEANTRSLMSLIDDEAGKILIQDYLQEKAIFCRDRLMMALQISRAQEDREFDVQFGNLNLSSASTSPGNSFDSTPPTSPSCLRVSSPTTPFSQGSPKNISFGPSDSEVIKRTIIFDPAGIVHPTPVKELLDKKVPGALFHVYRCVCCVSDTVQAGRDLVSSGRALLRDSVELWHAPFCMGDMSFVDLSEAFDN